MRRLLVSLGLCLLALIGLLAPHGAGWAAQPAATGTAPANLQPAATRTPTPTALPATRTLPATAATKQPAATERVAATDQPGADEQPGIEEIEPAQETGEWIRFTARVVSATAIKTARVFFQARQDTHTEVGTATIRELAKNEYELSYTHSLDTFFIRPFSTIDYRWELTLEDGALAKSAAFDYYYEDQRFHWNVVDEENFRVHWYNPEPAPEEDDVPFAQSVIDAAQKGFTKGQTYLRLPRPQQQINIYVYADSEALRGALAPNSRDWVAGHADPDLGVIVAALPPGPDRSMLVQQRIPHELMHVLLYQYTTPGYENLPAWLSEGLASLIELSPSSDYDYLLDTAVESQSLLPISSLCGPFPRDAASALLAYAESASFTRYLHSEYGLSGIDELTRSYANGLDCERGARRALGRSLAQLERNWRGNVLAENVTATAVNNLIPWISLAVIIFAMPLTLVLLGLRKRRTRNV